MHSFQPLRGRASKRAMAVAAALCLASLTPAAALAANGPGATVGAIRWDAWVGDTSTNGVIAGSHIGLEVEGALGPNQFHDRIPFYGVETSTSSVQVRQLTQGQMDADIAYAKRAGLNYWAFCYYADGSGMDIARNLYQASTQREGLNFTLVLGPGSIPTPTLVTEMAKPHFQKVLNGRPLLYLFGFSADSYAANYVAEVRAAAATAGLPNPYIVVMNPTSSTAASIASTVGADAVSAYADSPINGAAYSQVISQNSANWNNHKATGHKVVPWVTAGWDNRPRALYPQSFVSPTPPTNAWAQQATAAEVATNLQNALTWNQNFAATADANTVIMYAWNEFDEGGWLTPTLSKGTDRVDALSNALTYASSSNWDASQTARGAFDGDPSTNWQAASGFANQWVEIDFGKDSTFSQATISEYGARTTGYRIEYLNGSTWKTAYTGTGIGASSTVTFPAVTGRKARLYFTSGIDTPIIYEASLNATPNVSANLALNRSYTASSQWDATQGAAKAFDNDPNTNWQGSGANIAGTWLEVDFGVRKPFNTATLSEFGDRTGGYRIEYWAGPTVGWTTAYTGTTIGASKTVTFPTVNASKARIYWTSGTYTPIIYEASFGLN